MKYSKDELSNTLLITHKDCPDGCGCAVVFRAAGGLKENVRFVPAGRGVGEFFKKNVDYINGFDKILIADVAPDEKSAERIEKEFPHVICIDHHKTALFLKDREWCTIDMAKCGTFLLFDYLFEGFDPSSPAVGEGAVKKAALHNFAVLTNDRDLWLRQHRRANEMSMLMDHLGQDRYVERALEDFFAFDWKEHETDLLELLAEKKDKYIEDMMRHVHIEERDGKKFGYVFIASYQSDVLNRLLEVHDVDAAVGIKLDGSGVVSVRSGDSFDSSEFCKQYGGGGHAKASGHPISSEIIKELIGVIYP